MYHVNKHIHHLEAPLMNWNIVIQHVDIAGSLTETLKLGILHGNRIISMMLGEWGQSAKCKIILCSSVARAGDKSNRRTTISTPLTLLSHPTVYTGSRPSDVKKRRIVLPSASAIISSGNPSTCCTSLWKQVHGSQLKAVKTVLYNKLKASQICTTYMLQESTRDN